MCHKTRFSREPIKLRRVSKILDKVSSKNNIDLGVNALGQGAGLHLHIEKSSAKLDQLHPKVQKHKSSSTSAS